MFFSYKDLHLRNRNLRVRQDPRRARCRTRARRRVARRESDSDRRGSTRRIVRFEDSVTCPEHDPAWGSSPFPNFGRSWDTAPIRRSAYRSPLSFDPLKRVERDG